MLSLEAESVDVIVSSPPYCTRLDYVVATLPELAAIGIPTNQEVKHLRKQMLGGPFGVSARHGADAANSLPSSIRRFLSQVREHASKAAGTYYLGYYQHYFTRYASTLHELARVAKPGAVMVLVVQDSHFKNIHVKLAQWTIELAEMAGFNHSDSWSFDVPNPLALNPASTKYRASSATHESVLIFQRTRRIHPTSR